MAPPTATTDVDLDRARRWLGTVRLVSSVRLVPGPAGPVYRVCGIGHRHPFDRPVPTSIGRGLTALGVPTIVAPATGPSATVTTVGGTRIAGRS